MAKKGKEIYDIDQSGIDGRPNMVFPLFKEKAHVIYSMCMCRGSQIKCDWETEKIRAFSGCWINFEFIRQFCGNSTVTLRKS